MNLGVLVCLLLCSSIVVQSNAKLLPITNQNNKMIEQCLHEINKRYFKSNELKLVLNFNRQYIDLNYNCETVFIYNNLHQPLNKHEFRKIDVYIIISNEDVEQCNLATITKFLIFDKTWNARAKFVIISEEIPQKIFEMFMKYFVFNIVVLQKWNEGEINIYSYFPYASVDKQIQKTDLVLLDTFKAGMFRTGNEIFPNKLPTRWINIPLKVAPMVYPPYVTCPVCQNNKGIEIETLELLESVMDFKIEYVNRTYSHWGKRFSNGTYDEAYGDLQKRNADVALGMFHTNTLEHEDFDMSFSYMEDATKWIVPAAKPLNYWQNILLIFTGKVWMILLAFLILVAFVIDFLTKVINKQTRSFQGYGKWIFISYQVLIGNSTNSLFQLNAAGVKFILITWCISSSILTAAFQGKLMVAFSVPSYEKQIKTLQAILKSQIEFGFHPELAMFFAASFDPDEQYVNENYISCKVGTACLNRTAFDRDFATIKSKRIVESLIPLYYVWPNGHPMVYIFESNFQHVPVHMYFTKGHPMFDQINDLLIAIKSSGFISRFYNRMEERNKYLMSKVNSKANMCSKPLSFYQLQSIFKLLLLGLGLSSAVFLLELALKYM